MVIQAAFLREILAAFRGGELTVGTAILFWLLWTAVGSGICGRFVARVKRPMHLFDLLFPLYGILGYVGAALIGNAPFLFRLIPGEMVSYDLQFIAVILCMLPFNVLGGFLFALGAKALELPGVPTAGRAFTVESLGAAFGGGVFSLFLVSVFSNHAIAAACPVIAFSVSALRLLRFRKYRSLAVISVSLPLFVGALLFHNAARDFPYRGQTLLEQRETPYSRLRVTRDGEQITVYSDASPMFSAPNPESSEYIAHFPLLAVCDPRNVLIIGGDPVGVIEEALKYDSVERVSIVEIDPEIFTLAGKYLQWSGKDDPRVEMSRVEPIAVDARTFLKRTKERYDVIIMNLPAPLSGQTNRYYTLEFFELVRTRLASGGALGFSLSGSENYIQDDLALFLASIRHTLALAFPSVAVVPGLEIRFLASPERGLFDSLDWEEFERNRVERGIETLYFREWFLRYTMSPERVALLRNALDAVENPPVNSDMKPSGYFLRTVLEGKLDDSRVIGGINALSDPRIVLGAVAVLALFLLVPGVIPGRGARGRAVASTVLAVGLTEISLEVLAITMYQSFFGFLFSRIALLTGSYMGGLAIGGLLGTRMAERKKTGMASLALIQAGIGLTSLAWISLLATGEQPGAPREIVEAGFYLLTALAGLLGGIQFPIADMLFRAERAVDPGGGAAYGLDLAGSAAGALVTASLVIPVLGMYPALLFLAAINFAAASIVFWRR